MNTTNIKDEIGVKTNYTQNAIKLSDVEAGYANVPDAESEDGVAIEISEEGKLKLAEAQKQNTKQNFKEWAAQMKEDNENAAKYADDTAKIMTIFRRIANGDIVPSRDEKKLMEHSSEMYQAAKNLGAMKQNEDRKKYKSVDEDEKEESGAISQEEAIRALADSSRGRVDISVSFEVSEASR